MTAAELWDGLFAAGLVEGARPEPGEAPPPWYVRAMLGIAGWIAAGFLIGFLGIAMALGTHGAAASGVGALCCAAAFALFRHFAGQDFVEQLALAVSLAGQALIAYGLHEILHGGGAGLYFAFAVVEALLVLAIPNFLHRVLAAAGAGGALALALGDLALPGIASPVLCAALALIWIEPKVWARRGLLWRPIGYGAVLALLLTETFRLFDLGNELFGWRDQGRGWMALHGPLIGRVAAAAILVFVALSLARREGVARGSRLFVAVAAAALLTALVTIGAPGLASALLILLLGFAAGSRLLMAVGILSLLGFVSHFYYSLHATLLEKSGLMALAALLLIGIHLALRRMPAPPPEAANA
ncbi:MAG TPA: DUF4401 domain-containing protein [Allosphingosinicella sp.]|nr:DUF4401 domain-containing protein [Allosphingosinicella sp.]